MHKKHEDKEKPSSHAEHHHKAMKESKVVKAVHKAVHHSKKANKK